jgi:hypothetical protein
MNRGEELARDLRIYGMAQYTFKCISNVSFRNPGRQIYDGNAWALMRHDAAQLGSPAAIVTVQVHSETTG